MSDGISVLTFPPKGFIVILDAVDFYRCIPIRLDDVDYGVRPCDAEWALRAYGDGRRYAITQVITKLDAKVGVTLHRLLFEKNTKRPVNESFLDCRRANWEPVSKDRPQCVICGNRLPLKPPSLPDVHVFHEGKIVFMRPCSLRCQERAEAAMDSFAQSCDAMDGSRVYFIENFAQTRIKIGFSTDTRKRLGDLQTGCHERMVFIGSVPGSIATEKQWHKEWAHCRVQGEWFTSKKVLREAIEHAVGHLHWRHNG